MENLYKYIDDRAKEHGYKTMTDFCKAANISRATMSELKAGRTKQLSAKTSAIISNILGIPLSVLLDMEEYNPMVVCEDCGLEYNASSEKQVKTHDKRHSSWKKAADKFGFCWNPKYREEEKEKARSIVQSSAPLCEKIEAQIVVYKALFSRSLEASEYNLEHVDFPTYVSMILNQGNNTHGVSGELYSSLVEKFGKQEGIQAGTYYKVSETKKQPTKNGELSGDKVELMKLVNRIPDEKVSLVLRVLQSLLEADQ